MSNKARWLGAGLALTVLSMLAPVALGAGSAEAAVVYCKSAGVPEGCVAKPTAAAGAPGKAGIAGVGAGAQGAGLRAGTPTDRGGPVNRAGRH